MAVAWLERVPVEEITKEARQIHFWRTVLRSMAGVLFGVGWLAAKTCAVLWLTCAWSATAVKVGWREGRAMTQEGRRGAARTD